MTSTFKSVLASSVAEMHHDFFDFFDNPIVAVKGLCCLFFNVILAYIISVCG